MSRKLPELDFAGTRFYVDIELDEFRQIDNPANKIHFDLLSEDEDGVLMLAFDEKALNVYSGQSMQKNHPLEINDPDVEMITIKSFVSMDPVGVARKNNLPDDFFLD